ncbi:hypothetical protein JCM8097_001043 [Rhodosporidiobolus ruineniae]
MAAVYSKGLPQPVHQLAQGSAHSLHRDYASPSSLPASSSAFRSDASSSLHTASDDFGAFASTSHAPAASFGPAARSPFDAFKSSSLPGGGGSVIASRGAVSDGLELAALLTDSAVSLTDAIDGDWEAELRERQEAPWRRELETRMPDDPFASKAARAARQMRQDDVSGKGKGRAEESTGVFTKKGDMSPTSEELISSLSSLDLASSAYLRQLASLPTDLAVQDYLTHGLYADDVYGLPEGVQRLFDKAAQSAGEGVTAEEGRMKAVRRLGMVMQHLRASEAAAVPVEAGKVAVEDGGQRQESPPGWQYAGEYTMGEEGLMQLVNRSNPLYASPSPLFAQTPHTQHRFRQPQQQHQQQRDLASTASASALSTSEGLVFPSSLSSDAFITMTAPPAPSSTAAPATTVTPQPARLAAEPPSLPTHDLSSGPLPSFASYFADQHRRMVTNDAGRSGMDFTSRLPPSPSLSAYPAGVAHFMEVDEELRVVEGRSH